MPPTKLIDEVEVDPFAETEVPDFEVPNAIPRSVPSLLELDIPIPAAFRTDQSHATPIARPRRNTRTPVRYESSQSFADSAHDADFSNSRVRASTPLPNAPQPTAPRRDSQAYLDAIRKKPRTSVQITSAALPAIAVPAVPSKVVGRRVSWASRLVNCCAMTMRKATPPVSTRAPAPQAEECMSARCKQLACDDRCVTCDDRRETSKFTYDACAIAAFARETAERKSHDYASQRLHTSRHETIVGTHNDDAANARAAHDSHDSRRHIIADSQRCSNYSYRLNFESSALRSRRLARLLPPPTSQSISFAAVSANSFTPSMDPRDATEVFSTAALGFVDFRAACEVLRSCEAMDVFIRGLDAQFRRDIAKKRL